MKDQKILALIENGKYDSALKKLYNNFPGFKNAFIKCGGELQDAEDIFQDALLIFIEKILNQNLKLSCKIDTYLYGICANLAKTHCRKSIKHEKLATSIQLENLIEEDIRDCMEREVKYKAIDQMLSTIGERCAQLLEFFYLQGFSMRDIAKRMGFNSEQSAKTQKYKCLEKARESSLNLISKLEK